MNQVKNNTNYYQNTWEKKNTLTFYRQYLLANIKLISKFNEEFRFLLYVIDIYSKYA